MALSKLVFKPGVNKDQTNYASEGGWFDMDKVRFRSGFPEKLGGWLRTTVTPFVGVCRSLFNWITSDGNNLMSIATNKKVYIEAGGNIYDVTPIRAVFVFDGLTLTSVAATGAVGTVFTQYTGTEVLAAVSGTGSVGTLIATPIATPLSTVAAGDVGTVTVSIV
jgi:hypothetical protein